MNVILNDFIYVVNKRIKLKCIFENMYMNDKTTSRREKNNTKEPNIYLGWHQGW